MGEVNFDAMQNLFSAQLFYSVFVIIFMVLFLSMLIAQMTNTYNSIVRRGQLFYYKDIFDFRYYYNLDDRYGALIALDFPLSALMFLYLIPLTLL